MVDSTKQDSEYLKQSLDVMSRLWIIAHHDILTPLTARSGMTDILLLLSKESDPLTEKQIEYLTRIRDANQEAKDAVKYLAGMYQLVVDQIDLQIEKIDLHSLLQEVPCPEINYNIPANLPAIWADRSLLQKALTEILSQRVMGLNYDIDKNETTLTISFNEVWITFEVTIKGEVAEYFNEYLNPSLFVSKIIIDEHSGQLRIDKEEQTLNIVFTLPIKDTNREDAA